MKTNLKLTNETNNFQCQHNNTGFCKFGDHCRYHHFNTICLKVLCRNPECQNRHPKTCKFGENCKFNSRNKCVYKHNKLVEIESSETKEVTKKIKAFENEVKDLKADIFKLKIDVQLKEEQLGQTKDILKETLVKNEELLNKTVELEERFNCNSCYSKEGQKRDLEKHNHSKHEQPNIIEKLKTLLVNKDKEIEILSQKILDMNDLKAENQKEQILEPIIEDTETEKSVYKNLCPYCGKNFDNNSILKLHIVNHSGPNVLNSKLLEPEESDWETDDE